MDDSRRCHGHKKTGERCKKAAILGSKVCQKHGGGAPQVKRKAAERLADLIDPDRALRELAALAYSSMDDVMESLPGGGMRLKPFKKWPDRIKHAVSSIKVTKNNQVSGDGVQEDVVEVKLWNKPQMLELLFNYLKMLQQRIEVSGSAELLAKVALLDKGREANAKDATRKP